MSPNEIEAEEITGLAINDIESANLAAEKIMGRGVNNVIITLGETGAYIKSTEFSELIPGIKVKAIDTTAAGDVFNGALAVAVADGCDLKNAVEFANKAAAISVTKMGAQASAPYRNEVK